MKHPKRMPAIVAVKNLCPLLQAWDERNKRPPKEVAGDLGINKSTWSRWKAGRRFPAPDLVQRLAVYIGVPICQLFADAEWRCPGCVRRHR